MKKTTVYLSKDKHSKDVANVRKLKKGFVCALIYTKSHSHDILTYNFDYLMDYCRSYYGAFIRVTTEA